MFFQGKMTSILLLTLGAVTAVVVCAETFVFDNSNQDDVCSLCSCNTDKTEIDCSRRGLTGLPNGINEKARVYYKYF
jgi:hypothetical protein